ncbi:hypothetical protein J6590_102558, partial [Homalodisca vitripennis]
GVAKGGLRGRAAPDVTFFGVTPTQLTKADKRNLATQGGFIDEPLFYNVLSHTLPTGYLENEMS